MKTNLFLVSGCLAIGPMVACGGGGGSQTSTPDVFVAGYVNGAALPPPDIGGNEIAAYWKNGELIRLTDGTRYAWANAIAVAGSDVYVAGAEINEAHSLYVATYWKNGTPVSLVDGGHEAYATAIFVSGADVYVAGGEYINGIASPVYWKNGVPVELGDGSGKASEPVAITASTGNIYVAGYGTDSNNIAVAKLWVNGTVTNLSNPSAGSTGAAANAVCVSGSDVFVAGGDTGVATYWKNGVPIALPDAAGNARVLAIAVSGSNVYAGGADGTGVATWKNGALEAGSGYSIPGGARVASVALSGSVVDAVGQDGNSAIYWHGGAANPLPDVGKGGGANAIFIVPRD